MLCRDNTIILACGSLLTHVKAAQNTRNTCFPVQVLDRSLHAEPRFMREHILETLAALPESFTTILVAMGLCGGSWRDVYTPRRVVIPRVDDCITLLLHTDHKWHPNLKKTGHMYMRDSDDSEYSIEAMNRKLRHTYGDIYGAEMFELWFRNYQYLDIIDTGAYDSYDAAFFNYAKENADLIGAKLSHIQGSNLLLEKLVSGEWDEQFLVREAGITMNEFDFVIS